jgi:UDP-N-acetylmuramoyl-L-alanyl-D-glutamate--2,6-diaminopimelate ligase
MTLPLTRLAEQGVRAASMTADSRKVAAGSLFLAYPGEHADGRRFIEDALSRGAAAVLWERDGFAWNPQWQIPNVAVEGLRLQAGDIADEFYGQPSQKLWMIGVTGTNGKTSCSHWLAQAFEASGRKTAVIGTLGNGFIAGNTTGALSAAINTTPDPILLHGMLAEYLRQGAEAVAMEVSSHGLDQGRVNGVHFDVAVLTNLTRDHLDYHGDMQAYAAAKKKLFQWDGLTAAVLNTDDEFGREIARALRTEGRQVLTYGLERANNCDICGTNLQFGEQGLAMQVQTPFGEAGLEAALLGRFNAYNLLAVLAALLASGIGLERAVQALREIKPVAGRMQQIGGGDKPLVVIDYAHTPDALENVLATLGEQLYAAESQGRLICVFGCGGDRDAGKRPLMGAVAARLADVVIVTSDNPRNEDPAAIIADIEAGMDDEYHIQPDRARAIAEAVAEAGRGDIVLVAGKGHEDYQEIAGVRHPFSDRSVAEQALRVHGVAS